MRLLPMELIQTLRSLRRAPAFTATAVLCLTIGFGALIVMAAVADAFLLRPLPFSRPDRLVSVWKLVDDEASRGLRYFLSPADFRFLHQEAATLELAAVKTVPVDVTGDGEPARLTGSWSTAELMPLLGVQPTIGRWFTEEEERAGTAVVVLASSVWQRGWGRSPEALGTTLEIEVQPFTVIGVVPDRDRFPNATELWMPMRQQDWDGRLGFSAVGRLRDGVSPAVARQEIRSLGNRLQEIDATGNRNAGLDAENLQAALAEDLRSPLWGLTAAAAAFLTIAVANAGSLVLARSVSVRREMAVRFALGAGRRTLLRHSTLEIAVLTLAAAALGLLLARWALPLVVAASPIETLTFAPPRIDGRIVLGTATLALAITTLLGTAAVGGRWQILRGCVGREASIRAPRQRKTMARLVVADLAITAVILVAAWHATRSVGHLLQRPSGLATEDVATLGISAPSTWAETHGRRNQFLRRVLAEIETLPGVATAGAAHSLPMTEPEFYWAFRHLDQSWAEPDARPTTLFRAITPGYLEAVGMTVHEGRDIHWTDRQDQPPVVLVNRAFAARHWPGESALGKRLTSARGGQALEVVGVVSNVRERGLTRPEEPCLFRPAAQYDRRYLSRMRLIIRTEGPMPTLVTTLRDRLREIDPATVLFDPLPLADVVNRSVRRQQFTRLLLSIFALLALAQAAAGVYGLTTYDISRRRRELGLRSALGAGHWQQRCLVIGAGLRYSALGLAIGGLTTIAANRLIDSAWQIGPIEPQTYGLVAAVLVAVVLVATWPAAGRAARVEPAIALRAE
ncbi:MAG: ABC transporter permease [Acidobacteriota bacterium]